MHYLHQISSILVIYRLRIFQKILDEGILDNLFTFLFQDKIMFFNLFLLYIIYHKISPL